MERMITPHSSMYKCAVADLEGFRGVRLNPPLQLNYFNFMVKFEKILVKV